MCDMCEIVTARESNYAIVRLDVTEKKHRLKCSSVHCRKTPYECRHVREVQASMVEEVKTVMELKQVLGQKVTIRDRYVPVAVSSAPNPFMLEPEQQKHQRRQPYHDLKNVVPDETGTCPKCNTYWSDEDPVENKWLDTEVKLFPYTDIIHICGMLISLAV